MTRPTIEQIDAAEVALKLWICDGNRFTQKHGELTKAEVELCDRLEVIEYALRVLRQLMNEPTEEMRTAYFEAIASKDGEIWRAEYKAMRDKLLEQVGNGTK